MEDRNFYMVYLEGKRSPTHMHFTRQQAENECKRLVKNTGCKGFVLVAIKSYEPMPEFIIKDLTYNDEPPF